MAKLILPTKFGGVPYLNDSLISKIDYKLFNLNFAQFVCNLDIFDKFHEQKASNSIIKDLFKLNESLLLIMDNVDQDDSYGSSDINSIFVKSTNGKFKLELTQYIKYLCKLSPTYAVVPYEYITNDLAPKRIKRNGEKIKKFIELLLEDIKVKSESGIEHIKSKFLIPLSYNNQNFSAVDYGDQISMLEQANLLGGSILQLSEYKSFQSFIDLQNYIIKVSEELKTNLFKEGQEQIHYFASKTCYPIDILISMMIGANNVDASYAFDLSDNGVCIINDFTFNSSSNSISTNTKPTDYNIQLIDLKESKYESDNSILKEKCKCFTCKTGYTKAYINHLFKCNELNGHILLVIHNCRFLENMIKEFGKINKTEQWNSFMNYLNSQCAKI